MRFQIASEIKRLKLVKVNQEEWKKFRNIFTIIAGAEVLLSGALVIYDMLNGYRIFQDLKNCIIGILLIGIFLYIPEVCTYIQMPILSFRHLDGKQHIFVSDNAIEIQSEKYSISKKYDFESIKRIYDKGAYYKIIVGRRIMFIFKEDFILGTPEEFYTFVNEKING